VAYKFASAEVYMSAGQAWQDALHDALSERNPDELGIKIQTAETAIFERIQAYSGNRDAREEQALFHALKALRVLAARREPE
jgi:hypothetical protein